MNPGDTRYALVAVEKTTFAFDSLFTYEVPGELDIKTGMRVIVPFGRVNKHRIGVVFGFTDKKPGGEVKRIFAAADDGSFLTEEMLDIAGYMHESTLCTYYDAVRTMLPPGLAVYINRTHTLNTSAARLAQADGELSDKEIELVEAALGCENEKALEEMLSDPENAAVVKLLAEKRIVMVHENVKRRVGDETEKTVTLVDQLNDDLKLSPKQRAVTDTLADVGAASLKELCYLCGVTDAVVKRLADKGVVCITETKVSRSESVNAVVTEKLSDIVFSPLQQRTYDGLLGLLDAERPKCALLHGITGSGKTSVFIKLIEHCRDIGKTSILLVPEIALTPQTVGKFRSLFGSSVAIVHSSLSLGKRADEYKRIRSGEARIVIGTRSAVFAPCDNIGIIVIDEEGEHTYKSEMSPRYHARDIAKQRCFRHNALLLLASATPSFDSYYNALSGRYSLFEMNERYSKAVLPDVEMIDMRVEAERGNRGNFSEELLHQLTINLDRGEQSMLLLNRRGYHTYVNCVSCGTVEECPNCNIPLTYHKVNNSLICHYCGFRKPMPVACEKCGSRFIYSSGTGTQRIEDEIKQFFPSARVLRMDADTTMSKYSYEKRFREFADNEYDIMVGTQMIAKGLNFENVTLVGVLLIDRSLYAGDYLGYEKTFSLITQVVGRSGRGDKKGRAYIQTFSPEHYVLELAAKQDYKGFYEQESEVRKALIFPPYCDLCMIAFSSAEEDAVNTASVRFRDILKRVSADQGSDMPVIILGPTSGGRINGSFRAKIIVKCRNNRKFRDMLRTVMHSAEKMHEFRKVSFYVDFNGEII
ncbi:MAG: primosomal protein N' [Ruminiclostridium sp.]|nr:primosomal protein N' [Ruminiclostridium sp.]